MYNTTATVLSILQDVDDGVEFKKLCSALTTLGVGADIRKHLWRLLASLLHMGNIQFVTRPDEDITSTAEHKVLVMNAKQHISNY
jgi:myosin heavy subunit